MVMTGERLRDTHCHVADFRDPVALLHACQAAGTDVVAVTENPDQYRRLRTRLGRRTGVDVALGAHPLRAATLGPHDLARFARHAVEASWIGEVGLDYSRAGAPTARTQRRVFDFVLTEVQLTRPPMTVHSRGAEADVITALGQANLPAILHWYSGPLKLIDTALQAGVYFSINIAMTRTRRFEALARAVPQERILLETDGPYARDRTVPAHPARLHDVVDALAAQWRADPHDVTATIVANQNRLLGGELAERSLT